MPNQVDTNLFSWSQNDYSGERTTITVNTRSLADAAAYVAARDAFTAALDVLTNGNAVQRSSSRTEFLGAGPSGDTDSHREKKVLVRYRDNVTNKAYSFSFGCREDGTVTYVANSDFLDLSAAFEATLVTAIQAFVASPVGNPVTVISMQAVGRNI